MYYKIIIMKEEVKIAFIRRGWHPCPPLCYASPLGCGDFDNIKLVKKNIT